ncbi:Chromobox protein 1 [Blastocladiella emersonii ATCC 22665]|nr:Chromobox protein 1 [Blastocladiella emersonii ATCC 22665]
MATGRASSTAKKPTSASGGSGGKASASAGKSSAAASSSKASSSSSKIPAASKASSAKAPAAKAPAPPSDDDEEEESDEDETFEVEEIVNHKKQKNGKILFYLKWKGFSDDDNTWELEDQLDCPDLVKAYLEKNGLDSKGNPIAKAPAAKSTTAPPRKRAASAADSPSMASESNPKRQKTTTASSEGAAPSPVSTAASSSKSSAASASTLLKKRPAAVPRNSTPSEPEAVPAVASAAESAGGEAEPRVIDLDENEQSWEHRIAHVATLELPQDKEGLLLVQEHINTVEEANSDPSLNDHERHELISQGGKKLHNALSVHMMLKTGELAIAPMTVARKKAPQKLIEFLLDRIKFTSGDLEV